MDELSAVDEVLDMEEVLNMEEVSNMQEVVSMQEIPPAVLQKFRDGENRQVEPKYPRTIPGLEEELANYKEVKNRIELRKKDLGTHKEEVAELMEVLSALEVQYVEEVNRIREVETMTEIEKIEEII